jgi:hypothetical protein
MGNAAHMLVATGLVVLSLQRVGAAANAPSVTKLIRVHRMPSLCLSPRQDEYGDSREVIRQRFKMYRESGVHMLRVEVGWRAMERNAGQWSPPPQQPYLEEVRDAGFRVKLIAGTIMAPPRWFCDQHPEARIVDNRGDTCTNTIDLWYPGLTGLLEQPLRRQLEYVAKLGLLAHTDILVVDAGPAGESIYPANYQLGRSGPDHTFWCYSANARRDFAAAMRRKYRTVEKLNAAWGTTLRGWDKVTVPPPGTRPGACWEDVLTWYRDSKRRFLARQVAMYNRLAAEMTGGRMSVLLYIPGSDVRPIEWREAVATGEGDTSVKIMTDSGFLVDLGAREDIWLRHTGANNRGEAAHIVETCLPNLTEVGRECSSPFLAQGTRGFVRPRPTPAPEDGIGD